MLAKRVVIIILAFAFYINAYGQGSIGVTGGASVHFIVNSMGKYNNGVELRNWTRLRVQFNSPTSNGFILQVREAYNINPNILSENLIDEIDIETIEIEAISIVDNSGNGVPAIPKTITLAQGTYVELFNENLNTNIDFEVTITYRLGKDPLHRLIGLKSGYYFVDLGFNLIHKP